MSLYSETTLRSTRNGENITVTLRHNPIDTRRKEGIREFCLHGCRMVVDVETLPPWLKGLASELQAEIARNHLELTNIYSCSIPETATIKSRDLALFEFLGEIRHLRRLSCREPRRFEIAQELNQARDSCLVRQ